MKIGISVLRAVRTLAALGAMVVAVAACAGGGSSSTGGSGAPGDACSNYTDCTDCWECTCSNQTLPPARACVGGTCPTNDQACHVLCTAAGGSVVSSARGSGATCN
jgi:hypothetical protein